MPITSQERQRHFGPVMRYDYPFQILIVPITFLVVWQHENEDSQYEPTDFIRRHCLSPPRPRRTVR